MFVHWDYRRKLSHTRILAQASWVDSVPRRSLISIEPRYYKGNRRQKYTYLQIFNINSNMVNGKWTVLM